MHARTRRLIQSIVCGMACLSVFACASAPQTKKLTKTERARFLIEAANGALMENDASEALRLLLNAEEIASDLPDLHHSKALAFHAKRDLQSATEEARKAIKLNSKYSSARNTLGKLLMDTGNFREAEQHLLTAAKDPLNKEAFKANTNLGILYYRLNKTQKAGEFFDLAIREAPTAAACVSHYYQGHLSLRDGNFRAAIRSYERATQKICAGFADAHLALGIAFARDRQYDKARKKYLDIKQSFPDTKVAEQAMERLRYLP